MIKLISKSPEETNKIGKIIGNNLENNTVICMSGEMGAGKTALTQGIIRGLGVDDYITSPTYTLVNEYEVGGKKIYHFDVYRIEEPEEILEIGFEEYLNSSAIIIIEWYQIIDELLPKERILIDISRGENVDERIITIIDKGIGNAIFIANKLKRLYGGKIEL